MDRVRAALRPVIVAGAVATILTACQGVMDPGITKTQDAELSGDVTAYHRCVATAAARLDDGEAPIAQVADAAMDHCLPEALEVSRLLDSTKLPEGFKSRYLDQLLALASRQSAIMLRRRRYKDWDTGTI
jgi:hypothetical protein